jgi:hypothetical protein
MNQIAFADDPKGGKAAEFFPIQADFSLFVKGGTVFFPIDD